MENALRVAAINSVGDFVLFLGKVIYTFIVFIMYFICGMIYVLKIDILWAIK